MRGKMSGNYKLCKFYKKPECMSCTRRMGEDCEQGWILKSPSELREEGRKLEQARIIKDVKKEGFVHTSEYAKSGMVVLLKKVISIVRGEN